MGRSHSKPSQCGGSVAAGSHGNIERRKRATASKLSRNDHSTDFALPARKPAEFLYCLYYFNKSHDRRSFITTPQYIRKSSSHASAIARWSNLSPNNLDPNNSMIQMNHSFST
ncbi:hypothetical protein CDAR_414131 [Caerostris darwini]|uniref:Uncharacterized protein n=1 Tax=Caerostris darwini TaxID=1538125 RepID=A0AAV4REB7_9ARAC|nr:hypothetical protein CDAR_414131 [Caerostris darwini]